MIRTESPLERVQRDLRAAGFAPADASECWTCPVCRRASLYLAGQHRTVSIQCFRGCALDELADALKLGPEELSGECAQAVAEERARKARAQTRPAWANGQDSSGAQPFTVADEALRRLTHVGVSRRFARRFRDEARFVHDGTRVRVLTWSEQEGRWVKDRTGAVARLAREVVRHLYAEAVLLDTAKERQALADFAKRCESAASLRAIVDLAASEPELVALREDFDRDPGLLNCANGTVELNSGKLREHRRSDLITKTTGLPFDPDAKAPLWEAHLARVLPDEEARAFLQRFFGYSLTGVIREQLLLIAWGGGANGKTTTFEAIRYAMGGYAQNCPAEVLLARHAEGPLNELARLKAVRFATVVESEETARLAEARVKRLTGGDTVTARFLYGEFFDFTMTAKLVLCTNHKPGIRGTEHAIWRRLKLVAFTTTLAESEQDLALGEKLRAEAPGILTWCVRGCLDWQENGLQPPDPVREATESYRAEEDILDPFIEECCVVHPEALVRATELYDAYVKWCEARHERPMSQKSLGKALGERGFSNADEHKEAVTRKARWKGLSLRARPAESL
jgi:putative DNA primase/helicase